MKKQNRVNVGILVIVLFAIVSCNTKNPSLSIKADHENATVIIDGKEVGKVPLDIMVDNGKHLIEVYKETADGIFYDEKELQITENQSNSLNLKLKLYTDLFVDKRDNCLYKTVKIGDQIWMAENLKYLPSVNNVYDGSETEAKYYVYDYNGTNLDSAKQSPNYKNYGVLYNWTAAKQSCPKGWHLPSDAEWKKLVDYLGGEDVAGAKLKEKGTTHWDSPNKSTNETKFTALGGGNRNLRSEFFGVSFVGFWWSSTEKDGYAYSCAISNSESNVEVRVDDSKEYGFSVRCVKD